MADLQAKLADKECQLRNLTDECQKWKEKTEQAEAQVYIHVPYGVGLASIKFSEIHRHVHACTYSSPLVLKKFKSQCLSP